MRQLYLFALAIAFLSSLAACDEQRIKDRKEWGAVFQQHGITDGCFIIRDHTHEIVSYCNKDRAIARFTPASTFKIFNSLVALETGVAQDDATAIEWNGVHTRDVCDTLLTLREAFRRSCVPYFQELARRIGPARMQQYLDTVRYGNMQRGATVDSFWLNNALQISADEQLGLMRKLYFDELPFTERSQRIVRSMMLQEDSTNHRLYYKTGWGYQPDGKNVLWIVGFAERIEKVKEMKNSMNKSDTRAYPYFFALNFTAPNDSSRWITERVEVLRGLLHAAEVY